MPVHNEDLDLATVPVWMRELVKSGIRSPRVRQLSPGTKIFRFSNSSVAAASQAAGPWWFGDKAFQQIKRDALGNHDKGFGLGWSGRRALAIRQEWSQVDVLIEATIAEPINVFSGLGTKQYRERMPNGMFVTWEGWPQVDQWFIPNINDAFSMMTPLGKKVITIYRAHQVDSYQLYQLAR